MAVSRNATHHAELKLVLCQMTVYISSLNSFIQYVHTGRQLELVVFQPITEVNVSGREILLAQLQLH